MPALRLWPSTYPISAGTTSPDAVVDTEDIDRIAVLGNSWGNRWWKGPQIRNLRRQLEERQLAARVHKETTDDPSKPLEAVIEGILIVVREAERVSDSYDLWYAGD